MMYGMKGEGQQRAHTTCCGMCDLARINQGYVRVHLSAHAVGMTVAHGHDQHQHTMQQARG
jgi:hypothetical protein